MKRYDVKNKQTGIITNTWTSDFAGPEYYEAGFGTPAHDEPALNPDGTPQLNADGTPVMQHVAASYDVVETDITYEYALRECWANRVAEYPSLGDQMDAIYKRDHLDEPAQWQAIAAQIDAVKAKYPKPTAPTT